MNNKIIRKIYPLIFTFLSMHIFILNLYEIEVTNNVPKNTLIEFFYLYSFRPNRFVRYSCHLGREIHQDSL